MSATAFQVIIINALLLKNSFSPYGIKSQVSKTANTNNVTPLNAYNIICQKTLQQAYNTTTHYHHYQETRTLVGVFAKACNGKRKNTWP